MPADAWVIATEDRSTSAMVAAVRPLGGRVVVAAIGPQPLAEAVATAGADAVVWFETADAVPAEAYARGVAQAVAAAGPRVVLGPPDPAGRALVGSAALALEAVLVSGIHAVTAESDVLVVERRALGGRVIERLVTRSTVGGLFGGEVVAVTPAEPAPIERGDSGDAAAMRIERTAPASGAGADLGRAQRVVAVGRGLKARSDLAVVEELAMRMGAELACSMPIADDFRWMPKERYIGRSGQHIAPRLYMALGISGAPQHLEGVRDAKVVVAVNSDPEARIFHRATYGIVGDLYEVVPAIRQALDL